MPQPSSIDKFFGAVDDAYDVVLDTLKAGVHRGYRVSKEVIDQAQTGQREAVELAATIAKSPTDLAASSGAVVKTLTNTQGRALGLSRQWLDEAMDAQQEGREALRRLIDANRQAGEAVIQSSRGITMPNRACSELSCAALLRWAQRSVRSIDCAASAYSQG